MNGVWDTCVLTTLLVLASAASAAITMDAIFTTCLDTPREDLEPCLIKLIKEVRPLLEEGIPDLDLPSLSNLPAEDIAVHEDDGNNFIHAIFSNIRFKGFTDFDLLKLNIDFPKRQATYQVRFNEVYPNGRYRMDAQFLLVPLKGDGTFWFKLSNVLINGTTNFTYKEIDGDMRYYPIESELDYSYENVTMRLNGLFDNDPVLREAGSAFVNTNADAILEEVRPAVKRAVADIGQHWIRIAMRKVKYENLAGRQFY